MTRYIIFHTLCLHGMLHIWWLIIFRISVSLVFEMFEFGWLFKFRNLITIKISLFWVPRFFSGAEWTQIVPFPLCSAIYKLWCSNRWITGSNPTWGLVKLFGYFLWWCLPGKLIRGPSRQYKMAVKDLVA